METARVNERWRFKLEYEAGVGPRGAALAHLDPTSSIHTVKPCGRPCRWVWGERSAFPEVPLPILRDELWHEVLAPVWQWEAPIHELEAAAGNLGLRRRMRSSAVRGRRILCLSDSMCCVLAFSKGRATNPALLRCCRVQAAWTISGSTRICWRWIPPFRIKPC